MGIFKADPDAVEKEIKPLRKYDLGFNTANAK